MNDFIEKVPGEQGDDDGDFDPTKETQKISNKKKGCFREHIYYVGDNLLYLKCLDFLEKEKKQDWEDDDDEDDDDEDEDAPRF